MRKAVIEINSNQYLVKEGDTLIIDGNSFTNFNTLVCWESEGANISNLKIGTPVVEGYQVELVLNKSYKSRKVMANRFKAKSRYRKVKGHRQQVSEILVKSLGEKQKVKETEKKVETDTKAKVSETKQPIKKEVARKAKVADKKLKTKAKKKK